MGLDGLASLGHPTGMAKRKKKDRLRVGKEARRRARLGIGLPPPERTIPNKREQAGKPAKHKETIRDLLNREEAPQ